jgi:hypothetical protein
MIQIGTVEDGNGLVVNVYAEMLDAGGVQISVQVVEGYADLRGFFMDVGDGTSGITLDFDGAYKIGDESVTSVGGKDNNVSGTGETFDLGVEIGTAGMGRDDIGEATFTLQGVTLDSLDGLTFAVRATSVGEDRDDAVKLLGEFDIPEPPAEPPATGDSFPQLTDDISSIQLVYNTAADSTYVVQVSDVPYYVEDDLDVWLIDATHYLEVTDPNVTQDSELLGVAITTTSADDPTQSSTEYYAMDGDTSPDAAPAYDLTPDATVTYDTIISM